MLSSLKTYELCKQSTATDCEEKAILSPEIEDMLFVQKQCGDFVEKIDMHYMRKICDKEWESSRTKDSTKLIDCYLNYLAF
ncbi:MAG: hypothetical protein LBP53_01645 [Candidatus Peribacteria bacterium]|jgi:hypothetical protein|nr:hypothetical protein [Candidatus Peribacteria bacterium]